MAPTPDLEPARLALEFALEKLRRMEARVETGSREVDVPFGGRLVRMTQVPWKAGSIEDYLQSPAHDFAENVESALRLLNEGKIEAALTAASYMLSNLAALLKTTARGFKDEDREKKGIAASKGSGIGRRRTVGAPEREEILRRAAQVRAQHPKAASDRSVAEKVLQAIARDCTGKGGPFAHLAELSEKTVAKILSESRTKKSAAKG